MSKVVLSDEELEKLFALARLSFADKAKLKNQLSEVLSFVSVLESVDTSGVDETNEITGLSNVYQDDKGERTLVQEMALSGAKEQTNGYFMVPGVFADNDA